MKTFLAPLILVIILGCNGSIVSPEKQTPKLDETFEVKVGQSATVNGDFTLTFMSVPSDSRCPKNVVCVWEGNGAVVLKFSDGVDTLNTVSKPSQIIRDGYTIKLIALTPYPEYPQVIPKDAYIVKLVVAKN